MKHNEPQSAPHPVTERAVTDSVHLFSISANMIARRANSSKLLTSASPPLLPKSAGIVDMSSTSLRQRTRLRDTLCEIEM